MMKNGLPFTNGDINEVDIAMASDLQCVNAWLNANKFTPDISKTKP